MQTKDVGGFIKQNCLDCHNATEKSGGLDLATLPVLSESLESRNSWIRIYDHVHSGEMPPESKLTSAQREPFTNALRAALVAEISSQQERKGRTVLRRLNRREFENSLHDLLGVDVAIQHVLPEDGRSQGFDTVAEGLRTSVVQMEKYLEVIDVALDDAVRLTERPESINKRYRFQDEKEVRENLDTPEEHIDPISGQRHRRLFRELDCRIFSGAARLIVSCCDWQVKDSCRTPVHTQSMRGIRSQKPGCLACRFRLSPSIPYRNHRFTN